MANLDAGVNHIHVRRGHLSWRNFTLRKLIAGASIALFLSGGAFAASADPATDPETFHQVRDHGLCTAYYNGSARGQEQKHKAGPFVDLADRADQAGNDDNVTSPEEMTAFCDGLVGGRAAGDKGTPGDGHAGPKG